MTINVTEKQLESLERGKREAILVRSERTRKEYAIIPRSAYQQVQPLLQYVAGKNGGAAGDDQETWSEEKNSRRVALINKKYDDKLTRAETQELARLESDVAIHQGRVAPLRNDLLKLILEGLQQRAKRTRSGG